MFIDFSDFILNENEIYREYEDVINVDLNHTEFSLIGDIKYLLAVSKVNREILADLTVAYTMERPCDRCLNLTRESVESTFQTKLVDVADRQVIEDEEDISEYEYMEQNKVDIENWVREIVLVSMPMKLLCSDDCKGICPSCGGDLNETECNCAEYSNDPRLDILKNLDI